MSINKSIAILGIVLCTFGVLGLLGSNLGVGLPYFSDIQIEQLVILIFVGIILGIVGLVFD